MLWRRANEPFAGAWALPGGPLLPDETLGASVARQLASKVEVAQLAHLEQLETRSDPGRDPRGRTVADRLPGARPRRPGPGPARRHRLAPRRRPAGDGVRPRLDRRVGARRGCGPSCRTRTSGSRSPRRRSPSRSCATSTSPRSATRSRRPTCSGCCCAAACWRRPGSWRRRAGPVGGRRRSTASRHRRWRSPTRSPSSGRRRRAARTTESGSRSKSLSRTLPAGGCPAQGLRAGVASRISRRLRGRRGDRAGRR